MKKKYYKAYVVCRNCDYGAPYLSLYSGKLMLILRGKKVKDTKCPNCGCKELYNWNKEKN